ncbi:MAG TPA: agmatinase [Dehalococcoidia bacterium]|nr:agmatinase [Dehalococcoidia bacterium]
MAGKGQPDVRIDERFFPRRNFGWLDDEHSDYARARVVVLPVPYDSTTTARAGAREGPQAIIDASADMELYDLALAAEPFRAGIHTLPEIAVHAGSPQAMVARVQQIVGELIDDGKFVVTLGGEHSIAIGSALAHAERRPNLSILYLDAHADFRDAYLDTPYNHACALRRIVERGVPAVHVGMRSADIDELAALKRLGIPSFPAHTFRHPAEVAEQVVVGLRDEVYVSVDLDVFDSGTLPAVGTPEPGGLGWYDVTDLLAAVARSRRIVGFDLMELAPEYGPRASAQLAAKLAYRLIGLALS